jgi:hypothetical protein
MSRIEHGRGKRDSVFRRHGQQSDGCAYSGASRQVRDRLRGSGRGPRYQRAPLGRQSTLLNSSTDQGGGEEPCLLRLSQVQVLAGGALSGSIERHPIASPPPEPIGSAMSYEADVARARRLLLLIKERFATSLIEAATRFAISHPAIGTILVGMATPQQFEDALAAVQKGPLPAAALNRLSALLNAFAGELR